MTHRDVLSRWSEPLSYQCESCSKRGFMLDLHNNEI